MRGVEDNKVLTVVHWRACGRAYSEVEAYNLYLSRGSTLWGGCVYPSALSRDVVTTPSKTVNETPEDTSHIQRSTFIDVSSEQQECLCILVMRVLRSSEETIEDSHSICDTFPLHMGVHDFSFTVFNGLLIVCPCNRACPRSELNRGPFPYHGNALPAELRGHGLEVTGLEPVASCLQSTRSTIELHPHYGKDGIRTHGARTRTLI
eukprot:29642-Pelagococcus_subviridis.AAC.18